jgi:hypothetical protein
MRFPRAFSIVFAAAASLGLCHASSPAASSSLVHHPRPLKMTSGKWFDAAVPYLASIGSAPGYSTPQQAWIKPNQRQIRKARRRAHAAGKRNSFA